MIEASQEAVERFGHRTRELWDNRQSKTSTQLRDQWKKYLKGWWGYFRLAQERKPLERLDGWIRRHIRKCFWQRWHGGKGRIKALKRLGITGRLLRSARSGRGAWRMARHPVMQKALNNQRLRQHGFLCFADLTG